jgi:hypothetical protein
MERSLSTERMHKQQTIADSRLWMVLVWEEQAPTAMGQIPRNGQNGLIGAMHGGGTK